jgi:hypothetical protein
MLFDIQNERYNAGGSGRADLFHLDLPAGYFAGACAISLFTHMPYDDEVRAYLTEIGRLMRSGAALVTTWLTDPPMDEVLSDTRRAVYTRQEIDDMLSDGQFTLVRETGSGIVGDHLRLVSRKK